MRLGNNTYKATEGLIGDEQLLRSLLSRETLPVALAQENHGAVEPQSCQHSLTSIVVSPTLEFFFPTPGLLDCILPGFILKGRTGDARMQEGWQDEMDELKRTTHTTS